MSDKCLHMLFVVAEGERCSSLLLLGAPPAESECAEGLYCSPDSGTCEKPGTVLGTFTIFFGEDFVSRFIYVQTENCRNLGTCVSTKKIHVLYSEYV